MPRFIDRLKHSQGFKFRIRWSVVAGVVAVLILAFSVDIGLRYRQLEKAFFQQQEFVPTRIYSDVTRILPAQPRSLIEARLQALGYDTEVTVDDRIVFALHQIHFPTYLLPDDHPVLREGKKTIEFVFEGSEPDSLLQSILMNGEEIADLYLEPELVATLSRNSTTKEIRSLMQFNDFPAHVWKSIIAIEDQHFLDHQGFDPKGLARAIWVNLKTRSFAQGGSTLTQQLVKNLMSRRTKNLYEKLTELFLSIILEIKYSKETIMERYLNEVYLGQVGSMEVHGVAEGAEYFFGKRLKDLNLAEVALMAGLIKGPYYYSPYRYWNRAIERQQLVLKKMVETGQIAEEEALEALNMRIRLAPPRQVANKAPYFVDYVKAELIQQLKGRIEEHDIAAAGFRIYTTLDMHLNDTAQESIAKGIQSLEERLKVPEEDRLEGALASVDHRNGYIRALIGGRSYQRSTFNRILNMKRQVGSTYKPFVFLTAYLKGEDPHQVPYAPGHPVKDAPWTLRFDRNRQVWKPRNYDKDFEGWTSYRTALARSINTIAARLGVEVGIDSVIRTSQYLGIHSPLPAVPSLSLGSAELSPVELLRAYSTIANHGVQEELTVIRYIAEENGDEYARFVPESRQVLPPGPVDLLIDNLRNVFIDGTAASAYRLGFDRPAAGKTGTTSHHRDSWFVGFTPQLTTVVWVGMDKAPGLASKEGKKRIRLTGGGSSLPIWVQFMNEALQGEPPAPFPVSPHLTEVRIDKRTGLEASAFCPMEQTVIEKFILGQEPRSRSCASEWAEVETVTAID